MSDLGSVVGKIIAGGVIGFVSLVLIFGAVIPIWQMGTIQDSAEDVSEIVIDTAPDLLRAGKTVCNIDNIVISEIKINAIYAEILLNVEPMELEILQKWNMAGEVTHCEVAILDDLLPKDTTGNIWRNQLGITKAMKNIRSCTIIDCIEEYGLIEILEFEK